MDKELYYAVNPSGQGVVFTSKPVRGERCWLGVVVPYITMTLNYLEGYGMFTFPMIMWEHEPVKITLRVSL